MRYGSRQHHPAPEPLWRRLDRAAGEINTFLMVLATGLGILCMTCLIGLLVTELPITHVSPSASAGPPPAMGNIGAAGLPSVDATGSGR
jgi:hypothetical protein